MSGFEAWLSAQEKASAAGLAACISATTLAKPHPVEGRVIRPAPGSVVAAPASEPGTGEPDYFFHWLRDSAIVLQAAGTMAAQGDRSADWAGMARDFVTFSLGLGRLDGAATTAALERDRVRPELARFLRPEAELAALGPETLRGDVRYHPDGALDLLHWSRPQHDGAASRALTVIGLEAAGLVEGADELIEGDLDDVLRNAGAVGYDIWEESWGSHYHANLMQFAALQRGAERAAAHGDAIGAERYRIAAAALGSSLDGFWSATAGALQPTLPPSPGGKTLDMAVILAVLHAGLDGDRHSVRDPRIQATLAALERQAAIDYPINHDHARGVALGRYRGDRYVSAGPWYVTTFAAAEFRYRQAAGLPDDARGALVASGDASLAAARWTIPPSGALSEQFHPRDGSQTSAKQLAWSHAAFLTALAARRVVVG